MCLHDVEGVFFRSFGVNHEFRAEQIEYKEGGR